MSLGNLHEVRRVSHLLLCVSGLRVRPRVTTNATLILLGYTPEPRTAAGGAARTAGGGPRFLGGEARIWSSRVSTFLVHPWRAP